MDPAKHLAALRHFEADRLVEAAAVCEEILQANPDDWLALRLLGGVRNRQHDYGPASRLIAASLNAAPLDNPHAVAMLNELAQARLGQQDLSGALDCYQRAIALDPQDKDTLHNYGTALVMANRHAEALVQYRRAKNVAPDSAEMRFHEGMAMIALGLWPEAWDLFEARLESLSTHLIDRFPTDVPHWRGESDIRGKTILVQAEQGFGDTLQYLRFVPKVAALGARVVLRVQPALSKLLIGFQGAETVITLNDALPRVDVQCPLLSLPLVFRTTLATLPADIPYLHASPDYMMLWQMLLGPRRRRRIGVAWASRPYPPLRSIPLETLAPLLTRGDAEFHALQPWVPEADRAWLGAHDGPLKFAEVKDFADTAALIAQMDLVLAVDTAVAHLAGALGKPVWVLLPFAADFRWLIGRADSPWYPTARLFRQKQRLDWDSVVADVAQELSVWQAADQPSR